LLERVAGFDEHAELRALATHHLRAAVGAPPP
jgi:hypothetical protein